MGAATCEVRREGERLELATPAFSFHISTEDGLRAMAWENRLAGVRLDLGGGPELEVDLDAAERRIWIEGWRWHVTDNGATDPDAERGFRDGCCRAEFDDSRWDSVILASERETSEGDWVWARTYPFIPRSCEGRPATLVLGGYGMHDFRTMRVFLNGQLVGERRVDGRWTGPTEFDVGVGSAAAHHVRYGFINVVALQLAGQITRTARLEELDPHGHAHLPAGTNLATQFAQVIIVGTPHRTPRFAVTGVTMTEPGAACEATIELAAADARLAAAVTYHLDAAEPVLRRFVAITNAGDAPVRVMNVRLGRYATGASVSDGERGFPVYLDDAFFATLAHPAGWAVGRAGEVTLGQYPGRLLAPGETFACMEAVLGVAGAGDARAAFLAHVKSRMRRTVRTHDRPYAIFEPFGGWAYETEDRWFDEREEIVLDNIDRVAEGQRDTGCRFDIYSVDFWHDERGDLIRFDPERFPNGLARINERLRALGTAPGLWIDSSGAHWSIGKNPGVAGTVIYNPGYPAHRFLCRATEPIRSAYVEAFSHHVRENGVRLVKFDNLNSYCGNLAHDHLPGIYSTEAIHEGVIEMLRAIDEACPDTFLMLYWGYRSPWWLLHADTLFEPGLAIEAASPAASPTLHARDGVTQGLDQAQWWCCDVPALGKDSLGVWLSDWWWNSSIGAERWQQGFVMDLCRGSLLAQPWSDHDWLTPPERREMADFIALLRARPECFGNPRFILGNPWRDEPYGYSCSDGSRAFLALNNCTWEDRTLTLSLGPEWGLSADRRWELYRWYPDPARLAGDGDGTFGGDVALALRPFDVTLIEVVPAGEAPSLGRLFRRLPIPRAFAEPTREVPVAAAEAAAEHLPLPIESVERPEGEPSVGQAELPKRTVRMTGVVPPCAQPGILAVSVELFRGGRLVSRRDPGRYFAATAQVSGASVSPTPVLRERGYPAGWQAWRVPLDAAAAPRPFEFTVTVAADRVAGRGADGDMEIRPRGHFVPIDE